MNENNQIYPFYSNAFIGIARRIRAYW
jgi:hypothetical protein